VGRAETEILEPYHSKEKVAEPEAEAQFGPTWRLRLGSSQKNF